MMTEIRIVVASRFGGKLSRNGEWEDFPAW